MDGERAQGEREKAMRKMRKEATEETGETKEGRDDRTSTEDHGKENAVRGSGGECTYSFLTLARG